MARHINDKHPKSMPHTKSTPPRQKPVKECIGWREWVALPDLAVKKIKVKVDTGARTSALHVSHVEIFKKNGKAKVRFKIHPVQDSAHPVISCESALIEQRKVKSSVGTTTLRPVVRTLLQIGESSWPIELTLVNRDLMGFRMLLGREAIRGRYTVDPARSWLIDKRLKQKGIR